MFTTPRNTKFSTKQYADCEYTYKLSAKCCSEAGIYKLSTGRSTRLYLTDKFNKTIVDILHKKQVLRNM